MNYGASQTITMNKAPPKRTSERSSARDYNRQKKKPTDKNNEPWQQIIEVFHYVWPFIWLVRSFSSRALSLSIMISMNLTGIYSSHAELITQYDVEIDEVKFNSSYSRPFHLLCTRIPEINPTKNWTEIKVFWAIAKIHTTKCINFYPKWNSLRYSVFTILCYSM